MHYNEVAPALIPSVERLSMKPVHRIIWIGFICAFLSIFLVSGLPLPTATAQDAPTPQTVPCPAGFPNTETEGRSILCGMITVPTDRANPAAGQINVYYAVLKSFAAAPNAQPVLFINDGAATSSLHPAILPGLLRQLAPIRLGFDIVLVDMRGAGLSENGLNCADVVVPTEEQAGVITAELQALLNARPTTEDLFIDACRQSLAAKAELAHFTSQTMAEDLIDLMSALAYPGYRIYSLGYGSRLAFALMNTPRAQPLLGPILLDSPHGPDHSPFQAAYWTGQMDIYRHVFELCKLDRVCNRRYPNMQARFEALVKRYTTRPLVLDGVPLLNDVELYRLVYPFNRQISYVPYQLRLILQLEGRNNTTLLQMLNGEIPQSDPFTLGASFDAERAPFYVVSPVVYTNILCREDYAVRTTGGELSTALESAKAPDLLRSQANTAYQSLSRLCQVWLRGQNHSAPIFPAQTNKRVFILSGDLDNIALPDQAKRMADAMPNAVYIRLPNTGYRVLGSSQCANDVALAFLQQPDQPIELSCLAALTITFLPSR
jgi:pimeloyl-ACP methyl ester carboxylesterase